MNEAALQDGTSPEGRRRLLEHDYEPIPLNGKRPLLKDWNHKTITQEVLAGYSNDSNTGLRTGRLCVVDIDVRDAEDATAVSEAIRDVLGDNLFHRVGSKGVAICYFNPNPISKITVSGTPPGKLPNQPLVEFLGKGQQMAAYGIHPDTGREFDWIFACMDQDPLGTPLEKLPAVTPEKLYEAAVCAAETLEKLGYTNVLVTGAPKEKSVSSTAPSDGPIDKGDIREALAHIDPDCDRSIWIKIACALKSASSADSEFDGFDYFVEWSAGEFHGDDCSPSKFEGHDDCQTNWDSLAGIKDKGITIATLFFLAKEEGYTPASRLPFDPTNSFSLTDEPAPKAFDDYGQPLNMKELIAGNFPSPSFAWQDFVLFRHVNLLYGDGGSGKTMLGLQIALAIASGKSLFGRKVIQQPALVVLAEDNEGVVRDRLQAVAETLEIDLENLPLKVWCLPGLVPTLATINDDGSLEQTKQPFYPAFQSVLSSTKPCFLLLDTVSDIASLDENKRLPVNTLCKQVLGGFCRDHGTTVLVNAHPSKNSMNDGTGYAGSTAWNNAVRQRIELVRPKDKDSSERTLKVAKSNYGADAAITLYHDGAMFSSTQNRQQAEKATEEKDAVLRMMLTLIDDGLKIVRTHGNGIKLESVREQIKEKTGRNISKYDMPRYVDKLCIEGKLGYNRSDKNSRTNVTGFVRGEKP